MDEATDRIAKNEIADGGEAAATESTAPPATEPTGEVVLKRREEQRLLRGHRWVFGNEILRVEGEPAPGDLVTLARADGRPLGVGYYNPHSLLAVRLLSDQVEAIDHGFFVNRLRQALALRQLLYPEADAYRLVHGESDDLPGLLVDRFADCLAVQTLALGIDRLKATICDALEEVLAPRAIVERNESALREREGLPRLRGVLRGPAPGPVEIREADLRFTVDLLGGQKTGFFFDQRENRLALRRYARSGRVLDVFCNDGGFALHAGQAGATEVLGIDAAAEAVARARHNAEQNGLAGSCRFEVGEALPTLAAMRQRGEKFDIVVLDPPSFTHTRKQVPAAKRGYIEVNQHGLRVLRRGGILVTASCSFHVTDETFLACVQEAAWSVDRGLKLLEWHSQAPDHPILPAMPETRYLKLGIFLVP